MWIGVIENRIDPLKCNRAQVRIAGTHTEFKDLLPTESLPWSYVPEHIRVKEGDYVCGMFLDEELQTGIVLGVIPGIPDRLLNASVGFSDARSDVSSAPKKPVSVSVTSLGKSAIITESAGSRNPAVLHEPTTSRIARNEFTELTPIQVKKTVLFKSIPTTLGRTWDEPETKYNAVYPYNDVKETESGHVIEFDDTPGSERIHIYHRSGTSDEIHPDGTRVIHVHADSYEIVLSDKNIYVNGDVNITAKKNINLKCGEDLNIEVGRNFNLKAAVKVHVQGTSIIEYADGPFLMQGLPLSLNGGTPAPLGVAGPIVLTTNATAVVSPPVIPNPTDPGNMNLAQRPGANLSDKKPNELAPPSPTVDGIAKPVDQNVAPVPLMTTSEGADVMVRALNRAKITDPIQRAQIYAQAAHESGNFKQLYENFRYTDQGLIQTWPSRFNANNVNQYVRQPEKIANFVYANRMGNGNEASGDGWKYRGRGFIMLTGKENYIAASLSLSQDFINYPDAAASPNTAADISVWYFKSGKKTGYRGSYDDVLAATKFVNGGTIGLEDRTAKFELAKANTQVITYNSALV